MKRGGWASELGMGGDGADAVWEGNWTHLEPLAFSLVFLSAHHGHSWTENGMSGKRRGSK